MPECTDEASVCGYVQLNNMGISSQPICRCKAGISCPLNWNPLDGRTVMHGNDQYKVWNWTQVNSNLFIIINFKVL